MDDLLEVEPLYRYFFLHRPQIKGAVYRVGITCEFWNTRTRTWNPTTHFISEAEFLDYNYTEYSQLEAYELIYG